MAGTILGMVPKMFEVGRWSMDVEGRQLDLSEKLEELESKVKDMEKQVLKELKPGRKRYKVIDAYFSQVHQYKVSVERVLEGSREGQWKLTQMMWVPCIQRHYNEGQELLSKGSQLLKEGLTYNEVIRTRGEMLPVEEGQCLEPKVSDFLESAVKAMKTDSTKCIGIHGYAGAGKTNLMKHLYNKVYQDEEGFKAVYWATAPDIDTHDRGNYNKALQKCVADGMWIDLDNHVVHDKVRCASRILARLSELGPDGRAVFFLDNVKEEFPAYELLGIPSLVTREIPSVNCILVFNTLSKDVCNRMQCDLTLKMNLLKKEEAVKLFLHEVTRGDIDHQAPSQTEQRIQNAAIEVANECARMPLALVLIARAMASIKDPREWNNRLNELKGTVSSINNEEEKILAQLKFGYNSLKDKTVQLCFLEAASLLAGDRQVSKQKIINRWKQCRLIGTDRQADLADDQGHTVLNQLERMCLLQVEPDQQIVTMNKWICKMATKVSKKSHPT